MWKSKKSRKSVGVYSTYKIEGRNIPILLNKLKNNNIEVKNVKKVTEKTTVLTIKQSDSEKLFAIIDNMWYNTKLKDHGILYPVYFLTKNLGLFIGAFILLFSLVISNDLIFDISFYGTGSIYERQLLEDLNNQGVTKLSRFSKFDLNKLSNQLLMDNNNINYISLKKQGNTLKVNAVKKIIPSNIERVNKTEFICSANGILENIIVYRGTSIVSVNQQVKKGDLLVKGEATIKEQVVNVNVLATASVICDYTFEYQSDSDKEKNIALLLAKEILNKEVVFEKVTIQKKDKKFIYVVSLKYRVIMTT